MCEVHGDRVVFSVADTEAYAQRLIICRGRLSRDSNFVVHPCHYFSVCKVLKWKDMLSKSHENMMILFGKEVDVEKV